MLHFTKHLFTSLSFHCSAFLLQGLGELVTTHTFAASPSAVQQATQISIATNRSAISANTTASNNVGGVFITRTMMHPSKDVFTTTCTWTPAAMQHKPHRQPKKGSKDYSGRATPAPNITVSTWTWAQMQRCTWIRGICRGLSPGWNNALRVPVESGILAAPHDTTKPTRNSSSSSNNKNIESNDNTNNSSGGKSASKVVWVSREAIPANVTSPRPIRASLATKVSITDGSSSSSGGGSVVAEYNNQAADPTPGSGNVGDDAAEAVVIISTASLAPARHATSTITSPSPPRSTSLPASSSSSSSSQMLKFVITAGVAVNIEDASQTIGSVVEAATAKVTTPDAAAPAVLAAASLHWQQFWNQSRISLPTEPQLEAMWLGAQYNLGCAAAASNVRADAKYIPAPGLFGKCATVNVSQISLSQSSSNIPQLFSLAFSLALSLFRPLVLSTPSPFFSETCIH